MAAKPNQIQPPAPTSRTTVPLDALDVINIEEVSEAAWESIFDEIGYPPGITASTFTKEALLEHLAGGTASEELINALSVINELGTPEAVDAMKAVADSHQIDLDTIIAHVPRDAAAYLWLAQRKDSTLREVYTRIQMQTEGRRSPRTYREFCGQRNAQLPDWSVIQPRLLSEVQAWCLQQSYGDHVDIRGFVKAGDGQIQIVHGYRKQAPVVVKDGGRGRGTIELRPAHCDVVRYDWKGSLLRVSPKSSAGAVVEAYRRMFGRAFFEDEDFFRAAGYSLRALQDRGQAALDASRTVARAYVTDLVWQRGDDMHAIKSPDCLAAIASLGGNRADGSFLEAKIALTIPGRRIARRTLHVKVPNRVDYDRDDEHARVIESFLDASGIRVAQEVVPRSDLWSLHPWTHPDHVWRDAYPHDVDELVRTKMLRAVELGHVLHPDRPLHGNVLRVEDGFGVSIDDDVPPRLLTPTDVAGLELDVVALLEGWHETLGLEGDIRDMGGGLHLLGERSIDSLRCAVVALTRQPMVDAGQLGQMIRASVTSGATVGLVVPRGRASATGLPDVPSVRLALSQRQFWRDFLNVTGAADAASALWTAPLDARLVLDTGRHLVWLDGVALTLSDQLFQFLELLAAAKGNPVTYEMIGGQLSSNRDEPFARKVKDRLRKAIEASRATGGPSLDMNEVVRTVRGKGYALVVPAYVR